MQSFAASSPGSGARVIIHLRSADARSLPPSFLRAAPLPHHIAPPPQGVPVRACARVCAPKAACSLKFCTVEARPAPSKRRTAQPRERSVDFHSPAPSKSTGLRMTRVPRRGARWPPGCGEGTRRLPRFRRLGQTSVTV